MHDGIMTDEVIVFSLDESEPVLAGDDFERMLELLIAIAKTERRPFLAYLLAMALMEARNERHSHAETPH
jgi:hypothetical protein